MIGRYARDGAVAETQHDGRLVHRGMRLIGAVHAEAPDLRTSGETVGSGIRYGRVAGGGQCVQCGDRGGVVDDAFEGGRKAEQSAKPSEHDLLELRGRG